MPLRLVPAAFAYDRCVKTDQQAVDKVSLGSRPTVTFSPVLALLTGWPVSGLVLWEGDSHVGSDIGVSVGPAVQRAFRRLWLSFAAAIAAFIAIMLTTGHLLAGLAPLVAFVVYRSYLLRRFWIRVRKAGDVLEVRGVSQGFRQHVESLLASTGPSQEPS